MAASQSFKLAFPLSIGSFKVAMYSAFLAVLANLILIIVLTPIMHRLDPREPDDETVPSDDVDLGESAGRPGLTPAYPTFAGWGARFGRAPELAGRLSLGWGSPAPQ